MSTTDHNNLTLGHVLFKHAQDKPLDIALRFFNDGENLSSSLTYAALNKSCVSIADKLKPHQGKTALLCYPQGLNFLCALFACFYAGVIAVPIYPPKRNHHKNRLNNIIQDCQPAVVLTDTSIIENIADQLSGKLHESVNILTTNDIEMTDIAWEFPDYMPLAFLQYTSGSTGNPKGVMVSHNNIMANIKMAQTYFALPPNTHSISWLPLYHDMGLIGAVMMPLYWGAGAILMPPAAFLQKPTRLLQLIDHFGKQFPVGITQPNFAYQLLIDQININEINGLDLSQWVFALSGAEPVKSLTCSQFNQKFKPLGFNSDVLRPAYGLAEATLVATCSTKGKLQTLQVNPKALQQHHVEMQSKGLELVSSGINCSSSPLLIVDPDSKKILADKQVGEIWLSGDHLAAGYWSQPTLTEETFNAFTESGHGPFMRTGDFGFTYEQQLFVTGRKKDLLILYGKNFYPHDIESTVMQTDSSIQQDGVACFTLDNSHYTELVIVAELTRKAQRQIDTETLAEKTIEAVYQQHEVKAHKVIFIRFASLPKTSSGKIQRFLVKERYQSQELNVIYGFEPDIKSSLPQIEFQTASIDQIIDTLLILINSKQTLTKKTRLDSLAIDSIAWLQLASTLEIWMSHSIETTAFWQQETIEQLALTLQGYQKQEKNENDIEIEGCL